MRVAVIGRAGPRLEVEQAPDLAQILEQAQEPDARMFAAEADAPAHPIDERQVAG